MTIIPAVIFDDIEAWAVGTLDAALAARSELYADSVTVATEVPDPRADRMVIIRRDGGSRLDAIREAPRLGINIWAPDEEQAGDLARLVAALLWASPDGDPVSKVTITGGPYRIAEQAPQANYYLTAELIAHGRDLA